MPNITSLSPQATAACGTPLTLVINGTGFTPNSGVGVELNGNVTTVSYSYVSPTELTIVIPAADLGSPYGLGITVANPPPPGTGPMEAFDLYESSSTLYFNCGAQVSIDAASPALATIDRDVFGVNLTASMDLTNSNANYNTIMSTFRSANFGMARWPLAGFL
jgi:hypothetical protein